MNYLRYLLVLLSIFLSMQPTLSMMTNEEFRSQSNKWAFMEAMALDSRSTIQEQEGAVAFLTKTLGINNAFQRKDGTKKTPYAQLSALQAYIRGDATALETEAQRRFRLARTFEDKLAIANKEHGVGDKYKDDLRKTLLISEEEIDEFDFLNDEQKTKYKELSKRYKKAVGYDNNGGDFGFLQGEQFANTQGYMQQLANEKQISLDEAHSLAGIEDISKLAEEAREIAPLDKIEDFIKRKRVKDYEQKLFLDNYEQLSMVASRVLSPAAQGIVDNFRRNKFKLTDEDKKALYNLGSTELQYVAAMCNAIKDYRISLWNRNEILGGVWSVYKDFGICIYDFTSKIRWLWTDEKTYQKQEEMNAWIKQINKSKIKDTGVIGDLKGGLGRILGYILFCLMICFIVRVCRMLLHIKRRKRNL